MNLTRKTGGQLPFPPGQLFSLFFQPSPLPYMVWSLALPHFLHMQTLEAHHLWAFKTAKTKPNVPWQCGHLLLHSSSTERRDWGGGSRGEKSNEPYWKDALEGKLHIYSSHIFNEPSDHRHASKVVQKQRPYPKAVQVSSPVRVQLTAACHRYPPGFNSWSEGNSAVSQPGITYWSMLAPSCTKPPFANCSKASLLRKGKKNEVGTTREKSKLTSHFVPLNETSEICKYLFTITET